MANSRRTARPRLTSGFVFKSVFGEDPEKCRRLLELALGTRIARVEVLQPERELDVHPGYRAGRVDVLAEDAEGNRYDAEMQAQPRGNEVLRARHYQSLMDALRLRKGEEVSELRRSVVVFVCDFDPVGAGLRRYDCVTTCLQTGEPVGDGRRLVMLNARGSGDEVDPSLGAFLRAVAGEDVVGDPFVDGINAMIDAYVSDPEWMERYMTFEDELEAARADAEAHGLARGLEQGMKQGLEQGLEQGAMRAYARMVADGILDAERAAAYAGVAVADIEREVDALRG